MDYSKHFSVKNTKQDSVIPGRESDMIQNSDGCYVFDVGKWERLNRFLIMGCEGGTYYSEEKTLTVENAKNTIECIKENGVKVVDLIVEISLSGRAPKNDPAIFTLALACSFGDKETKSRAYSAIWKVCRIGTHLFTLMEALKGLRTIGGRGLKSGLAKYYTNKDAHKLEMDLLKYPSRGSFSHRDALRLCHPKPRPGSVAESLYGIGVGKGPKFRDDILKECHPMYWAKQELLSKTGKEAAKLIADYKLPRELIPTELLNDKLIWEALLPDMPLTALIRNLAKMTSVGLLRDNFQEETKLVVDKLTNMELLKKARIHPVNLLNAFAIYKEGKGLKGSLSWSVVGKVLAALEDAFHLSFGCVEPTGKNILLGLDVSGSMTWVKVGGTLMPREIEAAMALTFVKSEPNVEAMTFSSDYGKFNINKNSSMEQTIGLMGQCNVGSTDCSAPIFYARKNKLPVEVFIIMTDNETNASHSNHASLELKRYRQETGINAKMIVAGFTATSSSIADPTDPRMLDCVGFDKDLPAIINDFVKF